MRKRIGFSRIQSEVTEKRFFAVLLRRERRKRKGNLTTGPTKFALTRQMPIKWFNLVSQQEIGRRRKNGEGKRKEPSRGEGTNISHVLTQVVSNSLNKVSPFLISLHRILFFLAWWKFMVKMLIT